MFIFPLPFNSITPLISRRGEGGVATHALMESGSHKEPHEYHTAKLRTRVLGFLPSFGMCGPQSGQSERGTCLSDSYELFIVTGVNKQQHFNHEC